MKFSLMLLMLLSSQVWAKWSVSTYNIRNFDKDFVAGRTDISELQKIIKEYQSDVMAFEEIVNDKAFKTLMTSTLPTYDYKISSCGGGGKQRLALAYNPAVFNFIEVVEDYTFSGSSNACGSLRPMLLVTLELKSTKQKMSFGVLHLKAGGAQNAMTQRWQQYQKIEKLAAKYEKSHLVLLGDLNTTGYNIKDQDYTRFEDTLNKAGLRTMSENLGCTSYWAGPVLNAADHQPSILDHIVLQDKNVAGVQDVRVGAHCAASACRPTAPADLGNSYAAVSDHCPVQVTFK